MRTSSTMSLFLTMALSVVAAPWYPVLPSKAEKAMLYVSPDGNDTNAGTVKAPLATLEGARLKVRELKKRNPDQRIIVEFAGGTYRFDKPVSFTEEDSGTEKQPVVYRAAYKAQVRFTGSRAVSGLKPLKDAAVEAKLLPEAKGKVMVADLSFIPDLGKLQKYGFGAGQPPAEAELFYDDQPMTLTRWPKKGFIGALEKLDDGNIVLDAEGRTMRWRDEKDPWIFAYYHHDWAELAEPIIGWGPGKDQYQRDVKIKAAFGITAARIRCYVFNLLSELQEPKDYYIDRAEKKLYFIPPANGGSIEISVVDHLIDAKKLEYVHFEGFIMENVRSSAFNINGRGCQVTGCVVRNTGKVGGTMGGSGNLLYGCDVYNTGAGGVNISGGDRKSLTPGNNCAENNHVHHYSRRVRTYTTALRCDGCGNRLAHNLIHHGPHMAIASGGNENMVEYNEIHNAVYESGDAGAFYVGRDWTQRGNTIRYNYGPQIMGSASYGGMTIYLDDQHCGYAIYGNLFEKCNQAVFIGGGDDNVVDNNVFVDCYKAAHLDNRGMGWQKKATDDPNGELQRYLRNMPYQSELWAKKYPTLVNIMSDDPGVPKRNVFTRNVSCGGLWYDIHQGTLQYQTVRDNVVHDDDSSWIALKKDKNGKVTKIKYKNARELSAIKFEDIPVEKMGVYKDPRRASWPVVNVTDDVTLPHAARKAPVTKAQLSRMPTLKVPRGDQPSAPMELTVNYDGALVKNPAKAWFSHDGKVLKVSVESFLPEKRVLGDGWAGNEAVELAFMSSDGSNSDIYVLRGFTSGKFESFKLVSGKRVEYPELQAAKASPKVGEKTLTYAWEIPFRLIGATAGDRLRANVTVRRTATGEFIMWRPTNGDSTNCDQVGFLELAK